MKLGMLKLTNSIIEEIREGQKTELKLIDQLTLINQVQGGDFRIGENGEIRFRDRVYVSDVPELK